MAPKKKGAAPKGKKGKAEEQQHEEEEAPAPAAAARRSGRATRETEEQEQEQQARPRSSSGRRSSKKDAGDQPEPDPEPAAAAEDGKPARAGRGGKKSKAADAADADAAEAQPASPPSARGRRGGAKGKAAPEPQEEEEEEAAEPPPPQQQQEQEPEQPPAKRAKSAAAGGKRGGGKNKADKEQPEQQQQQQADAEMAEAPPAAAAQAAPPAQHHPHTSSDNDSSLARLAAERWPEGQAAPAQPDAALVRRLFLQHLRAGAPSPRGLALLDLGGYLERYLLPTLPLAAAEAASAAGAGAATATANNEDPSSSQPAVRDAHALSIAALVSARLREGLPAWDAFRDVATTTAAADSDATADAADTAASALFACLWRRLLALRLAEKGARWRGLRLPERARCVEFFSAAARALEDGAVRPHALKLVSLPLWHALSPARRELELLAQPGLAKKWRALAKKDAKKQAVAEEAAFDDNNQDADDKRPSWQQPGAALVPALLEELVAAVEAVAEAATAGEGAAEAAAAANGNGSGGDNSAGGAAAADPLLRAAPLAQRLLLAERLLELLSDLLSQLPTRRFVRAVVLDRAVLERVRLALGCGGAGADDDEDDDQDDDDDGAFFLASPSRSRRLDPRLRRLRQLLALAQSYARFPVDDHTGDPRTDADEAERADARLAQLQRLVFKRWGGERAAAKMIGAASAAAGAGGDGGDDADQEGEEEDEAEAERLAPLRALSLAPCSAVAQRHALRAAVAPLTPRELRRLVVTQLRLAAGAPLSSLPAESRRRLLTEALLQAYCARPSQRQRAASLPLYPTERLLFDDGRVPTDEAGRAALRAAPADGTGGGAGGPRPLPLPRLNLQFLSVADYLLRCFELYRLEAAYEVRGDLCDALPRLAPRWEAAAAAGDDESDDEAEEQPAGAAAAQAVAAQKKKGWSQRVVFGGWARMALPLESFRVLEVKRPAVAAAAVGGGGGGGGSSSSSAPPAAVTAELVLDVRRTRRDAADEWDGVRPHDVIFLCCVRPGAAARPGLEEIGQPPPGGAPSPSSAALRRAAGLVCVRGAQVLEVRDASGKVINDPGHPGALRDGRPPQGTVRTITLALDPAQYQRDVEERAAAAAKRQARDKRRAARERRRRLLMMGAEDEEDQEDEDDDATDPFLEEDVYASFNVVARREGKENNFAALLDALRDGLSAGGGGGGGGASASAAGGEGCVPLWLRDVLLGYGDPAAAHYTRLPGAPMGPRAPADLVPPGPGEEEEKERGDGAAAAAARAEAEAAMASAAGPYARCIDFRDTFLDAEHAAASFPQYRVKFLPPIVVDTSATHGALHGHVVGGAASAAWGSGVGGGGLGASSSSSSPLLHPDLAAAAREDDADAHLARALDELDSSSLPRPPYRATFPPRGADRGRDASCPGATRAGVAGRRAALGGGEDEANQPPPILLLRPYSPPNPGPYPSDSPQPNTVRFTPTQVEAVRAGVQPGLTLVVGPPGTGKTDTCAQVLSVLYRSEPGRRVLLCTHSNAALNDLFAKLAARAVPERHLLRLGAGERDLDVEGDFSRRGRVDAALARRLALLAEVARVARAMGSEAVADPEAAAATCESAGNFWLTHVLARWERFLAEVKAAKRASKEQGEGGAASAAAAAAAASANGLVARLFPFSAVFADAPGPHPLLRGEDDDADMEVAKGCFRHLARVFGELSELRAFELLRGSGDRAAYLATVQARVVAMTVTHAALKRREFLDLALQFDSLVMEEAGQVLDCESFLPMCLLQRAAGGGGGGAGDGAATQQHRLRRVVLVGDHHQLPPVVQNAALAKGAGLDQPLFTRLVRLGVPHVLLDAQGRCRPSIAALFAWRYRGAGASSSALRLRDLPCVVPRDLGEDSAGVAESRGFSPYDYANPGLAFDFQLIDPNDGAGAGAGAGGAAAGAAGGPQQPLLSQESAPRPHFWQNLPEAEYAVALYQFMRLLGYPADRIALLTTYNGQAALLRDIVERRCCGAGGGGASSLFGRPGCISTVDKYQGRQSDYVILSLVRTRRVGHLRDVRRLVVALSRARLGLYVFGSASLFASCPELRPAFEKGLLTRPLRLALVRGEAFSSLEAAQAAGGGRVAGLRAAGDPVPPPTEQGGATHFVSGLAEMGALVAQVAMERQQQQQQQQQQQAVAVAAAADQVMAAVEAEVTGGGGGGAMEDD